MARNEEKQLARLNRFYLSKQKEEEFKKRPPRPKLESLTTVYEIKKWLPSVMRDIEFYVKQMEVACYPDRQIKEFETRIDHLRGEYKAFVRKIRQLEPDLSATPWSDRPYAAKHRKTEASSTSVETKSDNSTPDKTDTTKNDNLQQSSTSFVPIPVPVLNNDALLERCFGYGEQREPPQTETDPELQDQPLIFSKRNLPGYNNKFCGGVKPCHHDVAVNDNETVPCCHATVQPCSHDVSGSVNDTVPCLTVLNPHSGVGSVTTVSAEGTLNIPYPDSSSEDEIT